MDNITEHFIVEKLLDELRAIRKALSTLHCDVQEQIDTIKKASEAQQQGENPLPILRAELKIPEAIEAKQRAANRKKNCREWLKLGVETATLLTVGFYAFVTYRTLKEIKKTGTDTHDLAVQAKNQADRTKNIADAADRFSNSADSINHQTQSAVAEFRRLADTATASFGQNVKTLDQQRQQFRQDQRAWLGVGEFHTVEFNATQGVMADITFINSGKTPARNVQQGIRYKLWPVALLGPTADDIHSLIFSPQQAVAPQGRFVIHLGLFTPARAANLTDEIIGTQEIISRFQAINDQKMFLYYFGELTYEDIFSADTHTTQFCIYLADPKTRTLGYCDTFNDLN